MAIRLVRQTVSPHTIRQASVFYRMAICLVRQTISPHTIRQAIVCTEWPSVWYAILSGQIVLGLCVERAYHIAPC